LAVQLAAEEASAEPWLKERKKEYAHGRGLRKLAGFVARGPDPASYRKWIGEVADLSAHSVSVGSAL
jgi:hypothetical protein